MLKVHFFAAWLRKALIAQSVVQLQIAAFFADNCGRAARMTTGNVQSDWFGAGGIAVVAKRALEHIRSAEMLEKHMRLAVVHTHRLVTQQADHSFTFAHLFLLLHHGRRRQLLVPLLR